MVAGNVVKVVDDVVVVVVEVVVVVGNIVKVVGDVVVRGPRAASISSIPAAATPSTGWPQCPPTLGSGLSRAQ
jgi:hypothetical protein